MVEISRVNKKTQAEAWVGIMLVVFDLVAALCGGFYDAVHDGTMDYEIRDFVFGDELIAQIDTDFEFQVATSFTVIIDIKTSL